nr:CheY-like superfamily [Tanacetum cinerariifolium]
MMLENLVKNQSHEDDDDDVNINVFPDGLRVLAVDDDPTSLLIIKKMLQVCKYKVTTCTRAEEALSILRRDKKVYDVVLSDVHMPDMDGLKLLEYIGLEKNYHILLTLSLEPTAAISADSSNGESWFIDHWFGDSGDSGSTCKNIIMTALHVMSADEKPSLVMKGVMHGACDYLIKPVGTEALRNIWQHVLRKKNEVPKDLEPSTSLACSVYQQKQPETPDKSSANKWQNGTKRRKDNDDDDDTEFEELGDSSSLKKLRVVWTQDLHSKSVTAVHQIGYEKAVPKKILELMNIPGLTREKVASHLQKYRIYLKRIHKEHESDPSNTLLKGNPGAGYRSIASLSEQEFQALVASGHIVPAQSHAALQPVALGRSANLRSPISLPQIDQQRSFSFQNQTDTYGQVQNPHGHSSNISKQINFLDGTPTNMGPKQPAGTVREVFPYCLHQLSIVKAKKNFSHPFDRFAIVVKQQQGVGHAEKTVLFR